MQLGVLLRTRSLEDRVERLGRRRVERKSVPGQRNCRGHEPLPRQSAKTLVGQRKAANRAGNAHPAVGRASLRLDKHLLRGRSGGRLAKVDSHGRSIDFGWHNQHVTAAADIAGRRPGHGKGEGRRDRSVNRGSPFHQDLNAGRRSLRTDADNRAVPAANGLSEANLACFGHARGRCGE